MLDFSLVTYAGFLQSFSPLKLWLADMAKNIMIEFFISIDIDNYHDKCYIFISFKITDRYFDPELKL